MTPYPDTAPAIGLYDVTKRFGTQTAVDGLSLEIPPGSAFGFVGPNGAGKTTTIKMLMGLQRSTSGTMRVLDLDPIRNAVELRQRVGYVPEQQFIHRWMTAAEAVYFCKSVFAKWDDTLCDHLLTLFELDPTKKVKAMSKGMVTKLALVLALAHEPELLILDEPMAGLDAVVREELLDGILQTVCDRNVTLLFSSHTLADVQRMAQRIGIIHRGRLMVHCDVDELLRTTKRVRAVLSNGGLPHQVPDSVVWQRVQNREWLMTLRDFAPDTVQQLRASNPVETIEVIDLGLEDIFKDYVRGWRASA